MYCGESSEIKTYRRYDTIKKRWTKPKTEDSVRTVPIDEDTLTILKKIKQEQSVFIENGMITNNENMIFIDLNYNVVTNAGVNKQFKTNFKNLKNSSSNYDKYRFETHILFNNVSNGC